MKVNSKAVLFWWGLVRIASIALLWVNLILGWVFNAVSDGWDGVVMRNLGVERKWYLKHDRRFDFLWSVAMLAYGWVNFEKDLVWWWLVGSFVYYGIGFVWYQFRPSKWVMVVFPNMFWELFLINGVLPSWLNWSFILPAPYTLILLLAIYALMKEWWVHISEVEVIVWVAKRDKGWCAE